MAKIKHVSLYADLKHNEQKGIKGLRSELSSELFYTFYFSIDDVIDNVDGAIIVLQSLE